MIKMNNIRMSGVNLSGIRLGSVSMGEEVKNASPFPRGVVAAWKTYGKTNTDADRNILKDYSGNGYDLSLMNLGYALDSGYGLHSVFNFGTKSSTLNTIKKDDFTLQINAITAGTIPGYWYLNGPKPEPVWDFKLKVSGIVTIQRFQNN